MPKQKRGPYTLPLQILLWLGVAILALIVIAFIAGIFVGLSDDVVYAEGYCIGVCESFSATNYSYYPAEDWCECLYENQTQDYGFITGFVTPI